MKQNQSLSPAVADLFYQSLETELGGLEIYRTAITCARNADLTKEWAKYLKETEHHVAVLRDVLVDLRLDPDKDTPGRGVVRHIGKALCKAMHLAKGADDPSATELVAAECVTLAETKDRMNWELLSMLSEEEIVGSRSLDDAVADIEYEEDEHSYHATGWTRELWIQALGMKAEIPPPEERRDAQTMSDATAARDSRSEA